MEKKFILPLKVTSKGFNLEFRYLENGWEIMNPPHVGGECDKYGMDGDKDILHNCMVQDGAYSYPTNLRCVIKRMWEKINEGEEKELTMKKFEKLGKTIEKCCLDIDKIEEMTIEDINL